MGLNIILRCVEGKGGFYLYDIHRKGKATPFLHKAKVWCCALEANEEVCILSQQVYC